MLPLLSAVASFIDRCTTLREAKQLHAYLITTSSPPDPSLLRRLQFFCSSNSSSSSSTATAAAAALNYATDLFNSISTPDIFSFNSLFRSLANARCRTSESLDLYARLLHIGIRPNNLTFPFVLNIFAHSVNFVAGKCLHSHVIQMGFCTDVYINNSLIFLYANCGFVDIARKLFDEMPVRDIVSWNSIMGGYLRCGMLDNAWGMFIAAEGRNARTWNSMITGLVHGGREREALELFNEMLLSADNGRVRPDGITVASVISACACLGALDQGRWVHAYLKRHGLEFDVVIGTALIDMYGKCGCLTRAIEVFESMPEKDVLAWTAMISAFAIHGVGEAALGVLEEMERCEMKPNLVTFGALLSAFAHSGMVEHGRWYFDAMNKIYLIEPQPPHYACMVDLLGRAGLFEEAERFIRSMPMEPDVFVWGALLGACRMHGNVELGEEVAHHLISLDPKNHAYYIILSDIYAKAKRFIDVKKVRAFMSEQGIKKTAPGCSMIEIDGNILVFSVKGTTNLVLESLEWVLTGINEELKLISAITGDIEELPNIT